MAICPYCSLFCDDLREDEVSGAGSAGKVRCGRLTREREAQSLQPEAVDQAALVEAVETARSALRRARNPLVVLTGFLSCEEQSAAIHFAERWHADIDTSASLGGSALTLARIRSGWLTATLADLAGRIDSAVTWSCSPERTYPRLWEKLDLDGQKAHLIRVEETNGDAMTYAENILRIPNGAVLETVHALRVRLKQSTWEDLEAQYPLDQFLSDLRGIEMGLFILGAETVDGGSRLVSELTDFFGELRGGDRWFGLCPGREPNDLGAAETLLSTCGLPDSLHPLAEESCEWRPRNKQNRWDGYDLVCLLGGPVELPGLNAANATLQIGGSMPRQINAVYLPAGRVGVTVPGTCLRFDGVPVHLGQLSVNQLPAITDLLERLMINR